MGSTDDGTFNYNGDDSDADSYSPTGWAIQTGYDEVEHSTDNYDTQGENQSSCPADSLSGSVDTTATDSNDQQWHDSGAVGPAGSTSTTVESDDGTSDTTWDNSNTDTYNEYYPMLGGWVAGTPETTTEDGSFDQNFDDPAPVTVTVGTPPATPVTMPVAADALSADRIPDLVGIVADGRDDGAAGPHATGRRHRRGDGRLHGRGRRRERPERRRGLRRDQRREHDRLRRPGHQRDRRQRRRDHFHLRFRREPCQPDRPGRQHHHLDVQRSRPAHSRDQSAGRERVLQL